jgi:putative DNA methylase
MTNKSFIESDFPVKEVSEESAREKNIRHGHISTLHIWLARRPLASSRASIYAALTPPPKAHRQKKKDVENATRYIWAFDLDNRNENRHAAKKREVSRGCG